jgi:hypothetical protein
MIRTGAHDRDRARCVQVVIDDPNDCREPCQTLPAPRSSWMTSSGVIASRSSGARSRGRALRISSRAVIRFSLILACSTRGNMSESTCSAVYLGSVTAWPV